MILIFTGSAMISSKGWKPKRVYAITRGYDDPVKDVGYEEKRDTLQSFPGGRSV